jgi:glycerol-3-phosphate acyltransferase PlsX
MRRKIRAVRTMRKNLKICRAAPIAGNTGSPTGFAPLAANIKAKRLQRPLKIGVDLMGSDNAPQILLDALERGSLPESAEIVLICTEEFHSKKFKVIHCPEFIGMDEPPLISLRKKKNASMNVGLRLLREGKLDALVSAGNTGALVSSAKLILKTTKGILRPALLTLMPTKKNPVAVLDVGANVQAKAEHLLQFAKLGVAYQKARGIERPSVGLLNIGSEAMKGTSEHRIAYHELQMSPLRFVGNIEGKSVFDGEVDVLVTDGFTGNILLKTAEGIASLILDRLPPQAEAKEFHSLHYSEYPGALLAGVRGVVIKCHGYSSPKAFINGILGAFELAKEKFLDKLINELH